jgi:anti-sigma28 factor (negative regulator of flagellin synthesis)
MAVHFSPSYLRGSKGTGVAPAKETPATSDSQAKAERAALVARLRERYRIGAYRVDARSLAKSILDQHLAS